MAEDISCNALQVLDRMLEFFADDGHWLKGGYDDRGGRRCLVGAAIYFSAMHGIYYGPVLSLLLAAFPGRQIGLPFFNDHRCGSVAELRSVIEKAAPSPSRMLNMSAPLQCSNAGSSQNWNANAPHAGPRAIRGKRIFCVPMCRRRHVSRPRALPPRPLPIEVSQRL